MIAGTTDSTAAYIKAHLDEDLDLLACRQPSPIEPALYLIDAPPSHSAEGGVSGATTTTTLILQVVSVKDVSLPLQTRLRHASQCVPEQASVVSSMFDEIPQEDNRNEEDRGNDNNNSDDGLAARGGTSGKSWRYLSLTLTDGFRRVMAIEHRDSLLRKASVLLPTGVALGAKLQLTLSPNAVKMLMQQQLPEHVSASTLAPRRRTPGVAKVCEVNKYEEAMDSSGYTKGLGELGRLASTHATRRPDKDDGAAHGAPLSVLLRLHGDNTVLLGGWVAALQMYTALSAQRQLHRFCNRMSLLPADMAEEQQKEEQQQQQRSRAPVTVHEVDDGSNSAAEVAVNPRPMTTNAAAAASAWQTNMIQTSAAHANSAAAVVQSSRIATRTWGSHHPATTAAPTVRTSIPAAVSSGGADAASAWTSSGRLGNVCTTTVDSGAAAAVTAAVPVPMLHPLCEWERHLARTPQRPFYTTAVITAVLSNLIIKEYAMPESAMSTVYVFSLCVQLSGVEDGAGRSGSDGGNDYQLNVELGDVVLTPMVGMHAAQLKALSVSQREEDKEQMMQRINALGSTLESCGVCRFTLSLRSMDSMVEVLSMQRVT